MKDSLLGIKAKDLRIGNKALRKNTNEEWVEFEVNLTYLQLIYDFPEDYKPIKLTEERLLELGFEKTPHFTVQNSMHLDIGRRRFLSIGCVGTPNEMLFITERNKEDDRKVDDLVCLHNYDYDGYLYLHKLQNICLDLGKELKLKTK